MQETKPIVLSGPGSPLVQLDPLELTRSRMFVCSNSGSGKSHAVRLLLEQAGQQLPVIIIDPEGEWATIRTHVPAVLIGNMARGADAPADHRIAGELALRLLKMNCSAVLDLSDLERGDQQSFVRCFIEGLFAAPPELWSPRLIVIDEAHRFAPEGSGEDKCRAAVIRLMDSGRKRGFGGIIITQRWAKAAKSMIAECNSVLIGRLAGDADLRRAAELAGLEPRQRKVFSKLTPGEFMAVGPAFLHEDVVRFRTDPKTVTVHPKPGTQIFVPPTVKLKQLAAQLGDLQVPSEPGSEPAEHEPTSGISSLVLADLRRENAELRERAEQAEQKSKSDRHRLGKMLMLLHMATADAESVMSDGDGEPVEPGESASEVAAEAEDDGDGEDETTPASSSPSSLAKLTGAPRRLLVALAQAGGKPVSRRRAALLSQMSIHSSTWRGALAALRRDGLMATTTTASQDLVATPKGIKAAGPVTQMPKGAALVGYWRTRLGKGAPRSVFDVLVDAKEPLLRAEVATRAGISETSSTWRGALAKLRGLSLIDDIEKTKLALAKELR
jgi:hypothetical protein